MRVGRKCNVLHETKSEVVGTGTGFSLAAAAYHVPGTVLVRVQEGAAAVERPIPSILRLEDRSRIPTYTPAGSSRTRAPGVLTLEPAAIEISRAMT
jgi:hypothetical protein